MNQNNIVAASSAVVVVEALEAGAVVVVVAAIVEVAVVAAAAVVAVARRLVVTRCATIVVSRGILHVSVSMLVWKGIAAKSSTRHDSNSDVASTVARWGTFPPTAPSRLVIKLVTIVEKKGISRVIVRKRRNRDRVFHVATY
jgi:hypothetical protein